MRTKAVVLITVFFFSFFVVFIQPAHATSTQIQLLRLAYRAAAPSVVAAIASSTSLVVGLTTLAGLTAYIVYKSGAVTALKNWWNTNKNYVNPPPPTQAGESYANTWAVTGGQTGRALRVYYTTFTPSPITTLEWKCNTAGSWQTWRTGSQYTYADQVSYMATNHDVQLDAMCSIGNHAITWADTPTVPTDVGTNPPSEPNFTGGSVFATAGIVAALAGAEAIRNYQTMPDSAADQFIAQYGLQEVYDDTGTQASTSWDNAAQASQAQMQGLNAIAEGVNRVAENTEGLSGLSTSMSAVETAVNAQTAKMDNVVSGVQSLETAITETTADQSNLATRWSAVKTAASTKFPFSIAAAWSVSTPSVPGTYNFASLPVAGHTIPINPMNTPISDYITWARQLLVYMFWVMTGGAILKKALEM